MKLTNLNEEILNVTGSPLFEDKKINFKHMLKNAATFYDQGNPKKDINDVYIKKRKELHDKILMSNGEIELSKDEVKSLITCFTKMPNYGVNIIACGIMIEKLELILKDK